MMIQLCLLLFVLGFSNAEPKTSKSYCESIDNIKTEELADQSTLAKEYPHLVALGYQSEKGITYGCRGVLISDNFVVTAAHCTNSKHNGNVRKVRLGELSLKDRTDETYQQEYDVSEIILHPNYKSALVYNDIALIKLDKSVKFTAYVKPICINNQKDIGETKFTSLIYGDDPFGDKLAIQEKVVAEAVSFEDCNKEYEKVSRRLPNGIDRETLICARGKDKPLCEISGMPLQVNKILVGISSFGKLCTDLKAPSVYTNIAAFAPWIESIVWKQNDDGIHFQ